MAITVVLLANAAITLAAPPAGAATQNLVRAPKPAPVATTTVAPTTTTLLPVPTTPEHGPGPTPGGAGTTTSTSTPAPTTTVPKAVIDALVQSVQTDLAQLDAIAGYDQDKGIVTVNEANAAGADTDADVAARTEVQTAALLASAQAGLADAGRRLTSLAIALYVRSDVASAQRDDPSGEATVNRSVVLGILIDHGRSEVARGKRLVDDDTAILRLAQQRAARARAAQEQAHSALSKSALALANAKLAAAGRAVKPSTGTPLTNILGPQALNAGELAAWYGGTGYHANTTVPMATLAGFYVSSGLAAGLRGDIAFAQSIVETGYFTFPSGGQLLGADNNFAGIGACDTCAHGWRFPDAQTGVAAQVQLLQAYATNKKIPTPLVGRVGVAGCCPTWLSLSGVWATATNYGYAILRVYKEMLDWTIPERLATAGL